jgi:hypothetical protein
MSSTIAAAKAPPPPLRHEEQVTACRLFFEAALPTMAAASLSVPRLRRLLPKKEFALLLTGPYATGCRLAISPQKINWAPWSPSARAGLHLHFPEPAQVIGLLRGSPSLPHIRKGLFRFNQLLCFDRLSKAFETHLKAPTGTLSAEEQNLRAEHLLATALRGVCLLSAADAKAIGWLRGTPPGILRLEVGKRPRALLRWTGFKLEPVAPGEKPEVAVIIRFADEASLLALLEERADPLVSLALGKVSVSGRIPLADQFSALLDRLACFTG